MSEDKQDKSVKSYGDEFLGAKLERVHYIPVGEMGYKSITLNFNNGKSICFEVELDVSKYSVRPVIKTLKGQWGMIKAAPDEVEKAVEDMTTKELVEMPASECPCLECNLPSLGTIAGPILTEPLSEVAKKVQATTERSNPISHINCEILTDWMKGTLAYSPKNHDGRIRESIVFTVVSIGKQIVLGICNRNGFIDRGSEDMWIEGTVDNNGKYVISEIHGFDIGRGYTLSVSYDYEYDLSVVQK